MAVTLKCADCGYSIQAESDATQTCPQCEGTMKKPAYKAKSGPTSSDKEKPREKPKSKPVDDEDDDDPKPKKKAAARRAEDDEDDEDDERPKKKAKKRDDEGRGEGGNPRDGTAAESLEISTGFKNKELMKQVEDELSRGEVLHWAARPCVAIAKRKGLWATIGGIAFAVIGAIVMVMMLTVAKGIPVVAAIVPGIFVVIGLVIAIVGPKMVVKQAKMGWYAVTDRRAIVFQVGLFGSSGQATSYEPSELRKMRVQKTSIVEGGGDLIFRTEVSHHTRTERDARGRTRTSTSTSTHHFGFMGIENVKEVETLVHKILLGADDDDDDE